MGWGGGEGGEWPKSCDVTFVSTVYLGSFEFVSKVESMSLLNPSDFKVNHTICLCISSLNSLDLW